MGGRGRKKRWRDADITAAVWRGLMQNAHTWLTSDGGSHQTLALKWQFLQAAPQLISAPFSMEIKRL